MELSPTRVQTERFNPFISLEANMRRRARFRGIKRTSKTLEKDILERSRKLAKDPGLLMPHCARECRRCGIRKSVDKMYKVAEKQDDPRKLNHAMNWGDHMVRAYAATVSLAEAGKVPYLASGKTPMGDVSYAVRGKVERDKLIGVQNYDHPELRLLAYWKIAKRDNLHLYSMEDYLFCSPDGPRPPEQYVEEVIALLPYDLDEEGRCPHKDAVERLRIRWKSADISIEICPDCAVDVNSMHILASRIAANDPVDDFEVDVPFELRGDGFDLESEVKVDTDLAQRYRRGELTDAAFIREHACERLKRIRASGKEIYILGDVCLGQDRSSFLSRLRGGEAEIEALTGFLSTHPMAIVSRSDHAANLLADLWPEHRDALLSQVASPETLQKLAQNSRDLTPAQAIAEAKRAELSKRITARLPNYTDMGPVAAHADRLAKAFLTEGKDSVVRHAEKIKASDHKLRSISYAFMAAVGKGESRSWQFTREERDFGEYLAPFAKKLLEEEGDGYHDALQLLLQASGSGEMLKRN
ncbi:MAG: hypothetical protein GX307_02150 [Euryarchaeota archaeon]|nr:hypothetical protein [Euryarchaeota archaeon]